MTETDIRIKQQAEWTRQYTLNQDQFKQLVLNKIHRANALQKAITKREMLVQKHR